MGHKEGVRKKRKLPRKDRRKQTEQRIRKNKGDCVLSSHPITRELQGECKLAFT